MEAPNREFYDVSGDITSMNIGHADLHFMTHKSMSQG